MARIKEYPSITSFDGTDDALAIEQTDGANNRLRKVSPAQLKQYMEAGDFEATGEVKDGHGNVLSDKVQCGVYISPVRTVQSKQHDAITFSANFPSTVFAAAIMNTLNAAYVFANVVKITPTEVQVGVYNDYTNALSGAFTIIYFYK